MHRTFKFTFLILLLSLLAFKWADEDFTKYISQKLENFRQAYPSEKAYLHTDKSYYMQGDTLWYKAYLVEGALHLADSASNTLYVDLIDQRTGKNVALRRTLLNAGTGNGEIVLADSIAAGAYTLRAYTNWMRNAAEEFFFHKDIHIFDPTGNQAAAPAKGKTDLQFFPEGGDLVAGIASRIAFKATGPDGLGEQVSGFILEGEKDTIASFKSEHLGMGRFQFAPKSGVKYQAFLKDKQGNTAVYPFPEVKESGYTLIADNTSNPHKTRIIAYAKIPDKAEQQVHIVGHSRGIVAFVAKGKISNRGLMLNVPNTELPDGITHLTLFNDQNRPVCERLIFIDHSQQLRIQVAVSKNSFKPREKSEIEIAVTDSAGNPQEANLSLAVTDAGQIQQQQNDQHILSYLLLSSDLKGFIEQPGYYFDEKNASRKLHRDYLMMTQGWTRFRWEDVLQDTLKAPQYLLEQGISISGEATRHKKPAENLPLSIYLSNDSANTFLTAETDAAGKFTLPNLVFADTLKVRLQGMSKKNNQSLTFKLNPFEIPAISRSKGPYFPLSIDGKLLSDFLKRNAEDQEIARKIRESREKLLKEVTIKGKKEVQRDSRKIYGTADATIKVTPQLAAGRMSILDILAGRVAGVMVTGSGMNASVSIRGNRGEPQFVLDGMPVDKDFIIGLNVNDVESIDVLKGASAAIFGMNGGNGVISVLTKRGNENYDYSQDIVPGVLTAKIVGFNVPKQFYAPFYEVSNPQSALPDYRATIFWAPNLKTDKNGKINCYYSNSDATTHVDIRVEGISVKGAAGFAKSTYSVN